MQQRRRGRPGGGRGVASPQRPRRGVYWEDTIIDQTLGANSQFGQSLDAGIPEDEKKGVTVTRILLEIDVVAVTAGTGGIFSAGIAIVQDDASAALSFPDPDSVGDDPGWLWRVARQGVFNNDPNDFSQARHYKLDLRAQRKYVGEDYSLMLIGMNLAGVASSLNVDGSLRVLYKRP